MPQELGLVGMGRASQITGLTPRQIRYYQEKGLIRPGVTPGGHRQFGREDIEILLAIRDMVREGLSLSQVRGVLAAGPARDPTLAESIEHKGYEDVKLYFGLGGESLGMAPPRNPLSYPGGEDTVPAPPIHRHPGYSKERGGAREQGGGRSGRGGGL